MASNPFTDLNPYQSPTEIVRAELVPDPKKRRRWRLVTWMAIGFAVTIVLVFVVMPLLYLLLGGGSGS
jgi:hypothetical protein